MAADDNGSKRKRALKVDTILTVLISQLFLRYIIEILISLFNINQQTIAKTAGVLSTVAFTTAGLPPAALAANKAKEVIETVDNTQKLLVAGAGFIAAGAAVVKLTSSEKAQDFLEAKPYWDQTNVPVNVYKNKSPFTGKVVSTKRIVGPKATGETCHIVIDHKGDFPVSYMNDCG